MCCKPVQLPSNQSSSRARAAANSVLSQWLREMPHKSVSSKASQ